VGRLVAVAVILAGIILPAGAQRSASRGGFSGHSAASSHGSFTTSAPLRFSAPTAYSSYLPPVYSGYRLPADSGYRAPAVFPGYRVARPGSYGARMANIPNGRDHRPPYRPRYGTGVPYVYATAPWFGIPWLGPDWLDYADTGDDSTAGYAPQGYDLYPAPPDESAALPPYPAPSAPVNPAPVSEKSTPVTLVYKDGRPSEQIQNYLLTPTTLTVWDGRQRDIPVDELDLVATEKANRDAGIDFRLPNSQ